MAGIVEGKTTEAKARYDIRIEKVSRSRLSEVDLSSPDKIPFGRIFSDHMFVADYYDGEWRNLCIVPFGKLELSPAVMALHYGQSIFEGMKAFKDVRGRAVLFRPEMNARRMIRSAERMAMPPVPEDLFLQAVKELVRIDKDWIPAGEDSALYIRPVQFATDEYIGVKPSQTYKFLIFACPVGPYYPKPVRVLVERHYSRACPGGTGFAKAAGNYGASLMPARLAQQQGYDQLLWTDCVEHRWIEESGTMNVFFVIDGVIVTPPLDRGTILPGVTRDSIITLFRDNGYRVEERPISVDEIVEAHRKGRLEDAFGTGTAATVTQIEAIGVDGEDLILPPVEDRYHSRWAKEKLTAIRLGKEPDPYGWVVPVE